MDASQKAHSITHINSKYTSKEYALRNSIKYIITLLVKDNQEAYHEILHLGCDTGNIEKSLMALKTIKHIHFLISVRKHRFLIS